MIYPTLVYQHHRDWILMDVLLACLAQFLLDLWLPLWPVVFQPALGILMAGSVRGCNTIPNPTCVSLTWR